MKCEPPVTKRFHLPRRQTLAVKTESDGRQAADGKALDRTASTPYVIPAISSVDLANSCQLQPPPLVTWTMPVAPASSSETTERTRSNEYVGGHVPIIDDAKRLARFGPAEDHLGEGPSFPDGRDAEEAAVAHDQVIGKR